VVTRPEHAVRAAPEGADGSTAIDGPAGTVLGFVLLGAVALLSVLVLADPGSSDVSKFWLPWMAKLSERGLAAGYAANQADYPPLTMVVLTGVSAVARVLDLPPFVALKLSLLSFLLATTGTFWVLSRSAAMAAALQLSLVLNSVALGYLDVYFAPTLLASLWALRARRPVLFATLFAITCLIKWQPLLLAPFAGAHLLGDDAWRAGRWVDRLRNALMLLVLPAGLVVAVTFSVFGTPILLALVKAGGNYMLSGEALNLGWIVTHVLHVLDPGRFGPLVGGEATPVQCVRACGLVLLPFKATFLLLYGVVWLAFVRTTRSFEDFAFYALAGYLAYFVADHGVHENHLFLAVLLAAVCWAQDRTLGKLFLTWALAANLNLVLFQGFDGSGFPFGRVVLVDAALPLSVLFTLLCTWHIAIALRRVGWGRPPGLRRARSPA
jgi:hypothetical protein